MATTTNGRASREAAESALTGADTDTHEGADTNESADAGTNEGADDAQPQPGEQTPAQSSRRAAAGALLSSGANAKPLVLADGCEWRKVTYADGSFLGKSGITVEVTVPPNGGKPRVREYLTWVPQNGRIMKIPTYGVFPIMDAGDLD